MDESILYQIPMAVLFLLWWCLVSIIVLRLFSRKRLTSVFILMGIRKKRIYQSLDWTGKQYFKRLKRLSKTKPIDEILSLAAVMYSHQMKRLMKVLTVNYHYQTKTHLLSLFEKASQQGYLSYSAHKTGKRLVVTEALAILGFRNVKNLIKAKKFKSLVRDFYRIDFTVNKKSRCIHKQ